MRNHWMVMEGHAGAENRIFATAQEDAADGSGRTMAKVKVKLAPDLQPHAGRVILGENKGGITLQEADDLMAHDDGLASREGVLTPKARFLARTSDVVAPGAAPVITDVVCYEYDITGSIRDDKLYRPDAAGDTQVTINGQARWARCRREPDGSVIASILVKRKPDLELGLTLTEANEALRWHPPMGGGPIIEEGNNGERFATYTVDVSDPALHWTPNGERLEAWRIAIDRLNAR